MSGRPPRLALVSREYPPFYGGGIGTYARWIVPALNDAGVEVHVVTEAHDATNPRVEVDGLTTVHRVPMSVGRGGWTTAAARFSINAGRVVHRLHRAGRIDAAEFAECEGAAAAMLMLRRTDERPPTIVQLHTPSEQLFALRSLSSRGLDASLASYFLAERLALRLTDEVLAPSAFIADWARRHYELPARPTVIPYASGPLPDACAHPTSDDAPTVLYVGRIEPRKGVESLILAWKRVLRRHPGARLQLAGADTSGAPDGGSMRAYLMSILDADERGAVHFLGRLNPEALRDEYARAHLCVIPSLWENFPNTCIESMASARAVLVGDAGGMREMIGDTIAGRTFPAGDQDALARVMCEMLDEGGEVLAARGEAARARIATMCDPQRVAACRVNHLRRIIDRTRPTDRGRLDVWREIESVASGDVELRLPTLDRMVRRWVEQEDAVA